MWPGGDRGLCKEGMCSFPTWVVGPAAGRTF